MVMDVSTPTGGGVGRPGSPVFATPRSRPLSALPDDAFALLHRHLREQDLREGAVLWDIGAPVERVFFPIAGLISIRVPSKDGDGVDVALVGHEGGAGIPDGYGDAPALTQGVVLVAGRFVQLPAQAFAAAMRQSEQIAGLAAACNAWLLLQSQLIAGCNAVHPADARLCRWLLRASDALGGNVVPVTQETIARALGIRRTTATLIAQQLQARGVINYGRGKINIRDRAALQSAACSCCAGLGPARWPSEVLAANARGDGANFSAAT
jgi:CRP-like cAMP-binding protein